MRILSVCGARPNVMKLAALMHAFSAEPRLESFVVHTGQHYDGRLSSDLFAELGMSPPDADLGVGPGTPSQQTTRILERFAPVLRDVQPDWVVVVGDVTSTFACALAAVHCAIPVAHVEAGLRSFDRRMPEELNRTLTDHMSDVLFATEPAAAENLRREGVPPWRVHLVGNVMIDTLRRELPRAEASDVLSRLDLEPSKYAVATIHRPENLEATDTLRAIIEALRTIARQCPVVFVLHPRTRRCLEAMEAGKRTRRGDRFQLVDALGYHDFLRLESAAAAVFTDSGGIQEETAALGVPCLTLRRSTERPVTLERGTNRVVSATTSEILAAWSVVARGRWPIGAPPELWDGRAAERIRRILEGDAVAAASAG